MNDHSLTRIGGNARNANLTELLTDPELLAPAQTTLRNEVGHLLTLLASPQGFDLFRSVDNEIFLQGSGDCRCIGMVSAKGGEGRTSIAILVAVFAALYARQGRVLLIDATLGGNGPGRYFKLKTEGAGLGGYCDEGRPLRECLSSTALDHLDLVTDASPRNGPAKLSQEGFARLLGEARQHYRLVVVDTPAAHQNGDVYSLARLLDAVVLVVRYGYLTREQILPLVRVLQENRISILGSILNRRIFSVPSFLYGN